MIGIEMDEVYRGYRIAAKQCDGWSARITHVRGTEVPLRAVATPDEGAQVCLTRARRIIDKYVEFLSERAARGGEPS